MRRAARVDKNHAEITKAFRACGMSVQDLSAVGRGCPDLVIGWRGGNYLVEIKNGQKTPGNRPLTVAQETWHATWGGTVIVALDVEQALAAITQQAEKEGRL